MKRFGWRFRLILTCAVLSPLLSSARKGITLLVVPREDVPVRLGLDVGARCPTLLLSYKIQPDESISLHGWSGTEWVNVTPESYAEGSFFSTQPESAVIVWKEGQQLHEALIPSQEWCPEAYGISTAKGRPLIHLLGRHYDFKYDDWRWFSENYNVPLNSINPDSLNMAWYHRRLGENLKREAGAGSSDLKHLSVIYGPELALQDADDVSVDEPIPDEATAVDADNPLTNSVPQAVVLGVGEAGELEAGEAGQSDAAEASETEQDE